MNTPATETAASAFQIDTGIAVPKISRGINTEAKYPFDKLEVGHSFFVPATEAMPNPGKSLASTVSSASKRYATEDGTRDMKRKNKETGEMETVQVTKYKYARKFIVRTVEENGVKGARVWRIEPEAEDATDE